MRPIRKLLAGILMALIVSVPGFAAGPNGQGLVSSADILSPFLCETNSPPNCVTKGTSTLYRTNEGVGVNIYATDFAPNAPHTVWFVVFNNPNKCAGFPHSPCGLGDLFTPAVEAAVFWAAGNYTDENGDAFFQAFVIKGPNSREPLIPGMLKNPHKAEIHFIYREHPYVPGQEHDAINTAAGSCPGGVTPPDPPGPDVCLDVGSSIHLR